MSSTDLPTRLSPHLTLREVIASRTATALDIDNRPTPEALRYLQALAVNVFEPVRALARTVDPKALLFVGSGYRSPALNAATPGASKTSQHMKGQALDVESPTVDNLRLARLVAASDIPFDELILEFYTPGDPTSGWLHISHVDGGPNKREVMTAFRRKDGDKNGFAIGLPSV